MVVHYIVSASRTPLIPGHSQQVARTGENYGDKSNLDGILRIHLEISLISALPVMKVKDFTLQGS